MKIEYKGKSITNLCEWETEIFSGAKKKHWKDGRSAKSIADFILNKKGEQYIKDEVSKVISEDVTLKVAYPEFEVKFDKFGHGREHDLAILGKTKSGKQIFIGLEAKVDEPFGETIADAYINAKTSELNGNNTNAPKRIEELLKRIFGIIKKSYFQLRYQLLYSTVGTLGADADIHIFFVLVFNYTKQSDAVKIKNNHTDYIRFFTKLGAKNYPNSSNFETTIEGKKLISIYKKINY